MSIEEQKSQYQTDTMTSPKAVRKSRKWLKWGLIMLMFVVIAGGYVGVRVWGWYTGTLAFPCRWEDLPDSKKDSIRALEGFEQFGEPLWYFEYTYPHYSDAPFMLVSSTSLDTYVEPENDPMLGGAWIQGIRSRPLKFYYGLTIDKKGDWLNPSIVTIHDSVHLYCDRIKRSAIGDYDESFVNEVNSLILEALNEQKSKWIEAVESFTPVNSSPILLEIQGVDPYEYEAELRQETEYWDGNLKPMKWVYLAELTNESDEEWQVLGSTVKDWSEDGWIEAKGYEGHVWLEEAPPFKLAQGESTQFLIAHYYALSEMPPHVYKILAKFADGEDVEVELAVYHESQRE